jgi:hypothetical protein
MFENFRSTRVNNLNQENFKLENNIETNAPLSVTQSILYFFGRKGSSASMDHRNRVEPEDAEVGELDERETVRFIGSQFFSFVLDH